MAAKIDEFLGYIYLLKHLHQFNCVPGDGQQLELPCIIS